MQDESVAEQAGDEGVRPVPSADPETEATAASDENPPAEPHDPHAELDEIEHEGATYQVPKALKGAFLMQADYTRKTQEVAALRKEVEAERAAFREAGEEEIGARARLVSLDDQIARFAKVDWDALENAAPLEAQKGWRHYQQLQQARGEAAGRLVNLAQQRG